MSTAIGVGFRIEACEQDGGDDEGEHVPQIADYQGPAASGVVDEEDAEELCYERDDGADALVFQCVIGTDAHLPKNDRGIVLDGTNAGHLDRGLESAADEETAEGGTGFEEFHVGFGFVLVFVGDGGLDLFELGNYPWIVNIIVGVKFGEDV